MAFKVLKLNKHFWKVWGESVSVTDLLADSLALTGSATLDGLTAQRNVGCDQLLCNDVNRRVHHGRGRLGRLLRSAHSHRRRRRGHADVNVVCNTSFTDVSDRVKTEIAQADAAELKQLFDSVGARLEGVLQMVYMLPERLPALVRPAFDLVLRRIRSLKRCVQACGCKIMTPRYACKMPSSCVSARRAKKNMEKKRQPKAKPNQPESQPGAKPGANQTSQKASQEPNQTS